MDFKSSSSSKPEWIKFTNGEDLVSDFHSAFSDAGFNTTTFKSSSSSWKHKWVNDVFINFRGEDARRSFVSHLVYALKNAGVKTYFDEENLHKGMQLSELLREIEWSRICIVIFSRNYTESIWCLDELEKIIECHKFYGNTVVPIFYDVEPSDVRHQKGAFEDLKTLAGIRSSEDHVKYGFLKGYRSWAPPSFDNFPDWDLLRSHRNEEAEAVEEIVSGWSSTLKTAADFSGWNVRNHR